MGSLTDQEKAKIDAQMENIAEITKHIKPNPKCRVSGCNGTRGYFGISYKDGNPTIMLCCGQVGDSEYAALSKKIATLQSEVLAGQRHIFGGLMTIYGRTFWGAPKAVWDALVEWIKKLISKVKK
jgi:hypothetical protein